jgi:hypothetical protein
MLRVFRTLLHELTDMSSIDTLGAAKDDESPDDTLASSAMQKGLLLDR